MVFLCFVRCTETEEAVPEVSAEFSVSDSLTVVGVPIVFNDIYTGTAARNNWEWTFYGGNPSVSSERSPEVKYDKAGVYTVSLKKSTDDVFDLVTKVNYIKVIEPLDGLVAHYKFDGDFLDATGFNEPVTNLEGNRLPKIVRNRFGYAHSAIEIKGLNESEFFFTKGEHLKNIDGLSISIWAKITNSNDSTVKYTAIIESSSQPRGGSFSGFKLSFGRKNIYWGGADLFSGTWVNAPFIFDEWVHIVCTFKSGNDLVRNLWKIYINGKFLIDREGYSTSGEDVLNDSINEIYISENVYYGESGNRQKGFDGILDELKIYNRALTEQEVEQLFLE